MELRAIGFLDNMGLVGAVAAADSAVKASDVQIIGKEYVGSGMVTIILRGDVAAVSAAMDVAVEESRVMGSYIGHHVIARPDEQLYRVFFGEKKPRVADEKATEKANEQAKEQVEEKKEALEQATHVLSEISHVKDEKDHIRQELLNMTVEDLRKKARSMNIREVTKSQIKFMKKGNLVELIIRNSNKEG